MVVMQNHHDEIEYFCIREQRLFMYIIAYFSIKLTKFCVLVAVNYVGM